MKNTFYGKLVSVVIPTHNRSEMLKRAVISVLNQDYKNLEVVIIADACTDNTYEIAKEFNDERVLYFELEENVGGAQARNIGIEKSSGEYIAFLDDDDKWEANKLSKQLEVFNDETISIISCEHYLIGNGYYKLVKKPIDIVNLNDLYYLNHCGSFSFCITKSKFVQNVKIDPKLKAGQDWDLWIKILSKTNGICKIVREPLVKYYADHEDKLTKNYINKTNSWIYFYRNYWNSFTQKQKHYHLARLINQKKNLPFYNNLGKFFLLKIILKSFNYHRKAYYNFKLKNYLVLLKKIILLYKN